LLLHTKIVRFGLENFDIMELEDIEKENDIKDLKF
jgi:hypothetical protein